MSQEIAARTTGAPPVADAAIGRPQHDRLGRFIPVLLALTVIAAVVEIAAATMLAERILAVAALSTALFAFGVTVALYQVRNAEPLRARIALALTLAAFGGVGAFIVPGVAPSMAMLPVLSVVVVMRYIARNRLLVLVATAVAASILTLVIDAAAGERPQIPPPMGGVFLNFILIGIVLLVLAGLADFGMEARDSLGDLRISTERQLRVTTARHSLVSSLRLLHAKPTPEATAASIVRALSELPLIDIAVVFEVASSGETSVIAIAGRAEAPVQIGECLPADRAAFLVARTRVGAWAARWAERNAHTIEDDRLTAMGVQAQAFAPILSGDVMVGLVLIATTNPEEVEHLLTDLPSVSEAAAVADTILAPALMARRLTLAARVQVEQIIAAGAFHPEFQPIVELDSGLTVGFEALSRFSNGTPPDRMFADAKAAGIGFQLEAVTMSAAIRDGALLPPGAWLSLNVSPAFLGGYDELARILAQRDRPIILEVTEHDRIEDYSNLHAAMRALGPDIRLAVDDAGAGIANFRHLVDLRPHLVKIDAGMIRGVGGDVSRQAMIVGLVHFAEVSGAQVLAEGIETDAELATVKRLGVTLGQGYLLARPAPVGRWIQTPAPLRAMTRRPARAAALVALRPN
jgi:EAL domain-containing protein (putative c-di-GMP-specific phosphodiesterase class I)